MEIREMRAFVAVVEEGGLSAAARRLHVSQPSVTQTVQSLERQLGVQLLVRGNAGVQPTDAGMTLAAEARAVLARHDQAVAAVARHTSGSVLRVGMPLELPPDLMSRALAELATAFPDTRAQVVHASTTGQFALLKKGELELGLVREHPVGPELDAMLVLEEKLGVLLAKEQADRLAGPDGVRLDALAGLEWIGFPREGSPAWYDEVVAVFRSHGLEIGPDPTAGHSLISELKFAAVSTGGAFTLAPPNWTQPVPGHLAWCRLVGAPLVRRTWAVWPASSHRRDLGHLVAALDVL
ncbi:LysR family transcriptional regulator [Amycolatopsis rhabdoformis]|uniref:LysR family transcriptional regulator n=1 Tax=Amycolatopsis rhabdoformis TaxID=1448059 RepID=A0ABZ1I5U1_9PSEU|nr:LysR family transcriptional regulator [Amycolatopsis rhabdoformis]WSE29791.1 LysR family transcriptional regulator [Amycolatopsis rhabdoformis]